MQPQLAPVPCPPTPSPTASESNVPPETRLALGTAVIEVTAPPHFGYKKFSARCGADAMKSINSRTGRELHLRGINAKVAQPGVILIDDVMKKR